MTQPSSRPSAARVALGLSVLLAVAWAASAPPTQARRRHTKRAKPPKGMVAVPATVLHLPVPGGAPSDAPAPQPSGEAPRVERAVGPFSMDAREVTVAEYRACVYAGRCTEPQSGTYFSIAGRRKDWADFCNWGKPARQDHPINCVTQAQAQTYCRWAGKALPTEEQWLAAAGAAKDRPYPWGDELRGVDLCWQRRDARQGTCAVGSHRQDESPYGALDMAGNVSEWTSSPFCPLDEPACRTPLVVTRGGNWYNPYSVRRGLARRLERMPDGADHTLGFRCAKARPSKRASGPGPRPDASRP